MAEKDPFGNQSLTKAECVRLKYPLLANQNPAGLFWENVSCSSGFWGGGEWYGGLI